MMCRLTILTTGPRWQSLNGCYEKIDFFGVGGSNDVY